MAALHSHRARQAEERLRFGEAWTDTGLVFTREDGTAIHPQRLTSRFEQLARNAQLPRIRLHDLRHSYTTAALAAGIPAKVVSERLGHASVMITLDTYSYILPSMQEDAAGAVAKLILEVKLAAGVGRRRVPWSVCRPSRYPRAVLPSLRSQHQRCTARWA